jgi:hypothetical protein
MVRKVQVLLPLFDLIVDLANSVTVLPGFQSVNHELCTFKNAKHHLRVQSIFKHNLNTHSPRHQTFLNRCQCTHKAKVSSIRNSSSVLRVCRRLCNRSRHCKACQTHPQPFCIVDNHCSGREYLACWYNSPLSPYTCRQVQLSHRKTSSHKCNYCCRGSLQSQAPWSGCCQQAYIFCLTFGFRHTYRL